VAHRQQEYPIGLQLIVLFQFLFQQHYCIFQEWHPFAPILKLICTAQDHRPVFWNP
jgi:hypothetical protein